jgi:WD40 repeat protein
MEDGALVHELKQTAGGTPFVGGVTFSPDGRLIASWGESTRVVLWQVEDGAQVHVLKHQGFAFGGTRILRVAFSPDGRQIVSLLRDPGGDSKEYVWSVENGTLLEHKE